MKNSSCHIYVSLYLYTYLSIMNSCLHHTRKLNFQAVKINKDISKSYTFCFALLKQKWPGFYLKTNRVYHQLKWQEIRNNNDCAFVQYFFMLYPQRMRLQGRQTFLFRIVIKSYILWTPLYVCLCILYEVYWSRYCSVTKDLISITFQILG